MITLCLAIYFFFCIILISDGHYLIVGFSAVAVIVRTIWEGIRNPKDENDDED